jgi:outer membrane autotransporter protein
MNVQVMKQRKRGGVAAAIACALLGSAFASERAHAIDLVLTPSTGAIKVGDTLNVDVLLTGLNANSEIVSAFDLDLLFNPQIFSMSAVQFSQLLGTDSLATANTATAGRIDFSNVSLLPNASLATLQGTSGTVRIATISLTATGAGQGTLTFDQQTPPGTLVIGSNPAARLTLDNVGSATFSVTQNQPPIANAGGSRTVTDGDLRPGETITLNAGPSTDPDGTITSYQWLEGQTVLGTGPTIQVKLTDGAHLITLRVTDNNGVISTDTVTINVAAAARVQVSQLAPFLPPNEAAMAAGIDSVCNRLLNKQGPLTSDQADLLNRCDGIQIPTNSIGNQVQAIEELNGEDFAAARVQMLLFSNFLQMGIEDRLMALRGGARGLSLANLNFIIDGQPVPVIELAELVKSVVGGASADEPGGLLDDKWSLWFRGNYTQGDKSTSLATPGFDASQFAMLAGLDYRVTNNFVVGGALSYGNSSIDFQPAGEGTLDTTTISLSLYGSAYLVRNLYVDVFANGANAAYNADRNIVYNDGLGLVSATAKGDTDGLNLSTGLNLGYEFVLGNITISPAIGALYIDANVDSFVEKGAGGLDLAFDDQSFSSFTVNAGVRANAILNFSWGVLIPQVRVDYVNELENDVAVFGVRFAADPDATAAPPIVIQTDNPDKSYWKLGAGFSAQFKHGFSGYVEYQRYEGFDFVQFHDISAGLRMQGSF